MSTHPSWFDTRALEIAREWTGNEDTQCRARLQMQIIQAMKDAVAPRPMMAPYTSCDKAKFSAYMAGRISLEQLREPEPEQVHAGLDLIWLNRILLRVSTAASDVETQCKAREQAAAVRALRKSLTATTADHATPPPAAPEQSSAQPWAPVTDGEVEAMREGYDAAFKAHAGKVSDLYVESWRAAGNTLLALRGGVAPVTDEDIAVLQRIRKALPDVGVNGWATGVATLDRVIATLRSQGGVAQGVVVDEVLRGIQRWDIGYTPYGASIQHRPNGAFVKLGDVIAALAPQHSEPQATLTEGGR